MTTSRTGSDCGFTLVELLAAVAVVAVGMVFVVSALNQCAVSLSTAQKTITASHLLSIKLWELDVAEARAGGSEEGSDEGFCEAPHHAFRWSQSVRPFSADMGDATSFVAERLNEETVRIFWTQGKAVKDVSVTRYVRRKQES